MDVTTQPELETRPRRVRQVTIDVSTASYVRLVVTVVAAFLVWRLSNVILVFGIALMLYAAFTPMVRSLERVLTRRAALATFLVTAAGIVLLVLIWIVPLVFNQILLLASHLPDYAASAQHSLDAHRIHLNVLGEVQRLQAQYGASGAAFLVFVQSMLNRVTTAVTIAVLTVYLLIEGPRVGTGVLKLVPRERRLALRRLASEMGDQVGGWVRGQLILSAMAGTVFCVLALLLRIPQAFALGALAALADTIPVLGLLTVVVTGTLLALAVSTTKAVLLLVLYLTYHEIEVNFLMPRVYGQTLGLTLTAVIVCLLIGLELMGPLGAVIALPVGAAVPSVIRWAQEWAEE